MTESMFKSPTLSEMDEALEHAGVKGMRWGVRKDERLLSEKDKALNLSQRSQVKLASGISALATIGITSNAAATLFQLQSRFEHLRVAQAVIKEAENNPFINDAGREALRATKSHIVKGLVSSALLTTAVSSAIGIVTHRTAKAYFAPIHKVYGDAKPKINSDLRKLGKDIKTGKRPKMSQKQYHAEVSKIVEKHMTKNMSNVLKPFHELARSQMGLEYNTKQLKITFEKLPNTDLAEKMTVTTPTGLKLVKAVKTVEHAAIDETEELAPDLEFFFDYKFDSDGLIASWSCPTIEIADDLFEGRFDLDNVEKEVTDTMQHSTKLADRLSHLGIDPAETVVRSPTLSEMKNRLEHYGVKGMRWGHRRSDAQLSGGEGGGDSRSSRQIRKDEKKSAKLSEKAESEMAKMKSGTMVTLEGDNGGFKTMIKKKDGTWQETFLSADAERFLTTRSKEGHELSTREMKEAVERQKQIETYNDLFRHNANKEMKERYEALTSKANYEKSLAEMRKANEQPGRLERLNAFLETSSNSFDTFQKLNDSTNGLLGDSLYRAAGLNERTAGRHGPGKRALGVAERTKGAPSRGHKREFQSHEDFLKELNLTPFDDLPPVGSGGGKRAKR